MAMTVVAATSSNARTMPRNSRLMVSMDMIERIDPSLGTPAGRVLG